MDDSRIMIFLVGCITIMLFFAMISDDITF